MPTPIELLWILVKTCMDRLSANAWKVVTYVAIRQFGDDPARRQTHVTQRWDRQPEVAISLKEFCTGVRSKRRRLDSGTGLSKSSVVEAINEAERMGILGHRRRAGSGGRTLASTYWIEWSRVRESEGAKRSC